MSLFFVWSSPHVCEKNIMFWELDAVTDLEILTVKAPSLWFQYFHRACQPLLTALTEQWARLRGEQQRNEAITLFRGETMMHFSSPRQKNILECVPFIQFRDHRSKSWFAVSHSQMEHYFFSYLLTWKVDLIEILAQMWQYVIFLSLKPTKVTSDFILY